MKSNRLFNLFVVIALIAVIALTVREAAATNYISSKPGSTGSATECVSLPSRDSIHSEYVPERNAWVTYTEDGPTGVDGGLLYLLSAYPSCSR